MPNLSKLLGTFLAARMLALAGGLEEMAKMPASTVQMLGAEKALFRYLRGEGTPPKHGLLFEHEFVRPLLSNERGKMARFTANKAVMAARLDNYGDKDKGEDLRDEAREKFEDLKG
jgi:nucleolar protein 56